jgi:hypothetical protein
MISSKLKYNPLSGWFKTDGVRQGKVIHGRRYVHYEGKLISEWLAAWKWLGKELPNSEKLVIHLNGDVLDNRERNLAWTGATAEYSEDIGSVIGRPDFLEQLCKFLVYDRNDGSLRYSQFSDTEGDYAWKMSDDRKVVFWCGSWYAMEDIVWLMVTGIWPERGVVHLNGDFGDMRIENLRRVI